MNYMNHQYLFLNSFTSPVRSQTVSTICQHAAEPRGASYYKFADSSWPGDVTLAAPVVTVTVRPQNWPSLKDGTVIHLLASLRGGAIGRGTALQAGRPRVRFPMGH
jgi:hypothetical protein